jgi:hypothetical protein
VADVRSSQDMANLLRQTLVRIIPDEKKKDA